MNNNKVDSTKFHTLEANYQRPLFTLDESTANSIKTKLYALYGEKKGNSIFPEFKRIISVYYAYKTDEMIAWEQSSNPEDRFSEKDVILITYGDLIKDGHNKPLEILMDICDTYLQGVFNTIHILPFFPYSSDRGFSITDFRQVDGNLGKWEDILKLKKHFKLMFDGVFNHISAKSFWFQEFLNGNPEFADFFTSFSEVKKISKNKIRKLMRPRTCDVLTAFNTYRGKKLVWTTFSPDQVDLKFQNPQVLLKMTEIMLYYIRRGADILRLDAVTYLWDELGTTGAHLWQTHTIIKLFREILNAVAPHVALITETNVPHSDNITYFGNGTDEAQMIYNFALPPLVLHTIQTGNATKLTNWAKTLKNPSDSATFFNFLDSHDGIGVLGAKGILSDDEINTMAKKVIEHGGYISYKRNEDGSDSPYELNITSFSAINNENIDEPIELKIQRYLAARSITLVIIGVPGVYLHGLIGSLNDVESIKQGLEKRTINRNILNKNDLIQAIEDTSSVTHRVSTKLTKLIYKRILQKAFHPQASQIVLDISEYVFSVIRKSIDSTEHIIALTNVSNNVLSLTIDVTDFNLNTHRYKDIISNEIYECSDNKFDITLRSYQVYWLKNIIV